ncbi:hypothetical protein H2203_000518 [Taxawa tesnikishii (nom. ined.)]|nr:hypothetical protein H2203_000518 [Dothideales sp. JES 119]
MSIEGDTDTDASLAEGVQVSSIFPQMAALAALETAANSREASSIAQYDPDASSPQAAQPAFNAAAEAQSKETSALLYVPTGLDAFGKAGGMYELQHPQVGTCSVSVDGSVFLNSSTLDAARTSRHGTGKIRLHHPYASPTKSSTTSPILASLDLESGILELDITALQTLGTPHIIDTAVSAILATALSETKRINASEGGSRVFPAPPVSPLRQDGEQKKNVEFEVPPTADPGFWRKALGKARKHQAKDARGGSKGKKHKLPLLTRGILHLLGFAFDTIVWILSVAVKVLTRLVVGLSVVVRRL